MKARKTSRSQRGAGTKLPIRQQIARDRAVLRQRLAGQRQQWKESNRRLRWGWNHPKPTLKQSLAEKGRRLKFDTKQLMQKNAPKGVNRKRAWGGGALAAGVLAPTLGAILGTVLGKNKKKKKA